LRIEDPLQSAAGSFNGRKNPFRRKKEIKTEKGKRPDTRKKQALNDQGLLQR
jgi:hypothetical protein